MLEGSSIEPAIVNEVREIAGGYKRVLVSLDSKHTHDHVLAELADYAPLVSIGSYCVFFDTVVEDMPAEMCSGRPWSPGNCPITAVKRFLEEIDSFDIDGRIHE